jgi:hypothetical protein
VPLSPQTTGVRLTCTHITDASGEIPLKRLLLHVGGGKYRTERLMKNSLLFRRDLLWNGVAGLGKKKGEWERGGGGEGEEEEEEEEEALNRSRHKEQMRYNLA